MCVCVCVYTHAIHTIYIYSHILSPTVLLLIIVNVEKNMHNEICMCLNHFDNNTFSFKCASALAQKHYSGLRLVVIILILLFLYLFVFLKNLV